MQQIDLSARAVLVKLQTGMPGNTRKDPRTTEEVKRDKSLGREAGKWLKQLYPDTALAPISQCTDAFYTDVHKAFTLLWPDEGVRLLPTGQYFEYGEAFRKAKAQWEPLRDAFLARFDEWVDWGKSQHNGTFDPKCYDLAKVTRAFKFNIEFRPLPASEQYPAEIGRLLGQEAMATDEAVAQAVKEAHADTWRRLADPLKHLVDFVKQAETKDRTRWCESLLGNVAEIAGRVDALNITQDKALSDFAGQIRQAIAGLTVDALKAEPLTRQATVAQVDAILAKMSPYLA